MMAFAGNCLGLTMAEFWRLSLAQYVARVHLYERTVQRGERHHELMVAQCIAMVANTGFRSFDKPREPKEFMPSEWGKRQPYEPKPKRRTRAQIAEEIKSLIRG